MTTHDIMAAAWQRFTRRWGWLLILFAGLAAYGNSFAGPFIFDDIPAILTNGYVKHPRHLWQLFSSPSQAQPVVQRPMVALSLRLNYLLGRYEVFGYHVFNLTVHLLAALCLYGVIRRTLSSPRLRNHFINTYTATSIALASGLLWVTHPLLTECVTYVTQRTESLMGLWLVLMLYSLARSHQSSHPTGWTLTAVIFCALGMGTKQSMLIAPLAALLYDGVFWSGSVREALHRHRGLYLGLAATWVMLAVCVLSGPPVDLVGFDLRQLSVQENLATQPGVLLHYLRLAFWPHPLVLSYAWPITRTLDAAVMPGLFVVCFIVAIFITIARRPAVGFVGAWILVTLTPTLVWPMPTEIIAERRMYVPMMAFIPGVVIGVRALIGAFFARCRVRVLAAFIATGLLGVVTASNILVTRHRNADYRSELSIWADTVRKQPGNLRAHINYGNALVDAGQPMEAIEHYTCVLQGLKHEHETTARWSKSPWLYYNLATALAKVDRREEAVSAYHEALHLAPNLLEARSNLGMLLLEIGRRDEALRELKEAVRQHPDDAGARVNLGVAQAEGGQLTEAIEDYRVALLLDPESVEALNNLGIALAQLDRFDEAIQEFSRALQLEPADAEVAANLAEAKLKHHSIPQ